MLAVEDLRASVDAGEIDTVLITFTDAYGRQLGKRMDARFFLESPGTHACDYLLTVDMNMDPVPGYQLASWERGYGDFHLIPDMRTLRIASWLERTALVVADVHHCETEALVEQAPRSILRRQIHRANAMGYDPMAGSELEYYIFNNSYKNAAAAGYSGLEPAGWYLEDYHVLQGSREETLNGTVRRHLAKSGVPVECSSCSSHPALEQNRPPRASGLRPHKLRREFVAPNFRQQRSSPARDTVLQRGLRDR